MDNDIKKYVDQRDIKTLRYVFSQSLDVDPMFEEYIEEYDYCISKGVFETHLEDGFTPLTNDKSKWDKSYWTKLCLDLEKNLSKKRLDHMRDVAKVIYAGKIKRLKESGSKIVNDSGINRSNINDNSNNDKKQTKSSIEENNAKLRAAMEKQEADLKRQKEELARQRKQALGQEDKKPSKNYRGSNGGTKPRKTFGGSGARKEEKPSRNAIIAIAGVIIIAAVAYLINR